MLFLLDVDFYDPYEYKKKKLLYRTSNYPTILSILYEILQTCLNTSYL